jgi:flagellar biosynthesis component FlhA
MGIVVNHMALADAVQTYTLLTIGAGLVSQIPALVGSVAGTILVSRVSADQSETGLGATAAEQFLALPQAMMLAGVMLSGVGLVPGMPTLTFLLIGGTLGFTGYKLNKQPVGRKKVVGILEPLSITSAPALELRLQASLGDTAIAMARIRAKEVLEDYGNASGIPFPSWRFDIVGDLRSPEQGTPKYEIRRMGMRVASGDDWEHVETEFLRDIKLRPFNYFGIDETLRWLTMAERLNNGLYLMLKPELNEPAKLLKFYNFLRLLVRERFPVRDAGKILEQMITTSNKFNETDAKRDSLVEEVRKALKEGASKFYLDHLWVEGQSKFLVAGQELQKAIVASATDKQFIPRVESLVLGMLPPAARLEISIVVVPNEALRILLWRVTENMFRRGELYRPVLVLSWEEAMIDELARVRPAEPQALLQGAG